MHKRPVVTLALATALLASTAACDMLDTAFTVDSGPINITLDTAQMGLNIPSATIPAIPCTSDAGCGSAFKCGGTGYSCALKCVSQKCEIQITVEQGTDVDLSSKIKDQTSATVLSKVTMDALTYNTSENTLTFNTPEISMYLGPQGASSTSAAGVERFATMPSIKAKDPAYGEAKTTEAGKDKLQKSVQNLTPFRLFGQAVLKLRSGDPVPKGRLVLVVRAYFIIDPAD